MLSMLDIDFQYWIVGKGPDEEAILQYVEENGLQGKVRMLGIRQPMSCINTIRQQISMLIQVGKKVRHYQN